MDLKKALELHDYKLARGAQIRSRIKWIDEGEKNTKYFLRLEKQRASVNTITTIQTNTEISDNYKVILGKIQEFYSNLYKKTPNAPSGSIHNDFLANEEFPSLSDEEQTICDKDISVDELTEAVKKLNDNSAPGSDGITTAFYKHFWDKLKNPLLDSLKVSLEKGHLSYSQRKGIITLIHKGKGLEKNDLNNYRPITLTNTDYKIYAKTLAIRLQSVIRSIINEDQAGFIKGRHISTHLRFFDDLIKLLANENRSGALLALDFSKAFDTISKQCIKDALKAFKFGPRFSHYINALMENTESCISNGGWLSNSFPVERGIRQGCPVSPLLFVIAVETLAIKIRNSPQVQGISIYEPVGNHANKTKIKQFADDTSLTLKNEVDIHNAIGIIEEFGKLSGLQLNKTKTQGLWLGSRKHDTSTILGIELKPSLIKILGINFSANSEASLIDENWKKILDSILCCIKQWERRNPSLLGKVTIIKTLLLSQLSHILQVLALPTKVLNTINTIIYRFLWKKKYNNKRAFEKIKRGVLSLDIPDGGLKMINIENQQNTFLIKWASRLVKNPDAGWAVLAKSLLLPFRNLDCAFNASCKPNEIQHINDIKSEFWKRVVQATTLLEKPKEPVNTQPLWNNCNIQFKNKPLFFITWSKVGINFLQDVCNQNGLLTFEQIQQKVGTSGKLILEFNAIRNAIPADWIDAVKEDPTRINPPTEIHTDSGNVSSLPNKTIRQMLDIRQNQEICATHFWKRKLDVDITDYFGLAKACTKETRLRLLHFKLLHNIYPTNILLHKMGVRPTRNCDQCNEVDYIEHAFFFCPKIQTFWLNVKQLIFIKHNVRLDLNILTALFGVVSLNHTTTPNELNVINHILLIAKMCISKYKFGDCKNLDLLFETETRYRHLML
jgi:hypothetical protein